MDQEDVDNRDMNDMNREDSNNDNNGWWWLAGIVGLIIIIAVFAIPYMSSNNSKNGFQAGIGGGPPTATPTPSSITSLDAIVLVPQNVNLNNSQVTLQNVNANSVSSDNIFWVGTSQRQIMVLSTGASSITPGQKVNVEGIIKSLPQNGQYPSEWNLTEADKSKLKGQSYYIKATSVTITSY